eukprot:TRINITY_DN29681_c0_g1_i1.p1 TRINITY_DN29681_c0_g1~~TRINITY_DN29681_c0_g1_i1.p1  ORF type:complete len:165 (-),score=36.01 TRINITY_DN29681_c0_g1_i1:86-526(-)
MDVLCGLFDALSTFSEVVSRTEDKDKELQDLTATVESVSQSVRSFSSSLDPEDRDDVFNNNQVFPQLAKVVHECHQVIAKHSARCEDQKSLTNGKPAPNLAQALRESFKKGSRTLHEGLEVLSSKFGSLASKIQLPEEMLAVMRDR